MAKRAKYVKPASRAIVEAEVVATTRISAGFDRVTVAGEHLSTIEPMGADQWFRLFFPQSGQTELRLPTAANNLWYAQYLMMSKDTRPIVRNYTIRAYRAAGSGLHGDTTEIDIDFAHHGDIGPASSWASTVTVGSKVALLDEGCIYQPTPEPTWQLLIGDESALPAVLGILESAPPDLRAEVYLEIAHEEDKQGIPPLSGVKVHWLVREDPQALPGVLALETVRGAELPTGHAYTFVAGEQALCTGIRRHLVNDRHFAKADITFTGFWRHGRAAG